jgi:hypothetical protein
LTTVNVIAPILDILGIEHLASTDAPAQPTANVISKKARFSGTRAGDPTYHSTATTTGSNGEKDQRGERSFVDILCEAMSPRASSLVTPRGQQPIVRTAFCENPAFAWLTLEDVKSTLRECRACGGVAWCKSLEAMLTPGVAKAA